MPIDTKALWDRLGTEADNKAQERDITGKDQNNAFAHIYVSAQLVREYGSLAAFVAGTSQELRNHWTYRSGGPEPGDPHQLRDSFRDLWNNGIG